MKRKQSETNISEAVTKYISVMCQRLNAEYYAEENIFKEQQAASASITFDEAANSYKVHFSKKTEMQRLKVKKGSHIVYSHDANASLEYWMPDLGLLVHSVQGTTAFASACGKKKIEAADEGRKCYIKIGPSSYYEKMAVVMHKKRIYRFCKLLRSNGKTKSLRAPWK